MRHRKHEGEDEGEMSDLDCHGLNKPFQIAEPMAESPSCS